MLKNNGHKTRQHRGSPPPFQGIDQGHHEWETGLSSLNQYSDESPYLQFFDQPSDQEKESDVQESEARQLKEMRNGQDSYDEADSRRTHDDENRWQDDGGENG